MAEVKGGGGILTLTCMHHNKLLNERFRAFCYTIGVHPHTKPLSGALRHYPNY